MMTDPIALMRRSSCRVLLAVAMLLSLWTELVAETPRRIISTDAGATEIIIALGLADHIVGFDDSSRPATGSDIPRLGYHRALSAEGLVALAPDLVIGSTQMGPPHVMEALQRSQIPVLTLEPPMTPAKLRHNIAQLAQALQSESGNVLLSQFDDKTSALQLAATGEGLRAAFLLRAQGGLLRLAGTDTAGDAFIKLIATDNLADHTGYRSLSPEAILALQPDILLIADTEGRNAEGLLADLPLLRYSHAAENQRLLMIDPNTLVSGLSMAAIEEALRVQRLLRP